VVWFVGLLDRFVSSIGTHSLAAPTFIITITCDSRETACTRCPHRYRGLQAHLVGLKHCNLESPTGIHTPPPHLYHASQMHLLVLDSPLVFTRYPSPVSRLAGLARREGGVPRDAALLPPRGRRHYPHLLRQTGGHLADGGPEGGEVGAIRARRLGGGRSMLDRGVGEGRSGGGGSIGRSPGPAR